ncbi:MAG: tyrosine-type recombinase/integrase [Chthoniobacteraceae bacterium]
MKTNEPTAPRPRLEKVGECLYRYSSNGVYYALVKSGGKQKKRSLETTDQKVAKRKLGDFKRELGSVDLSAGKVTLRELCDRYMATVQNQKRATVSRKKRIAKRLLEDFPDGSKCQISKIKRSALEAWLAKYPFGYASRNLYVHFIKALFDMAVNDRLLHDSPAAGVKGSKVQKPVRITPSFEEFQRIIEDVRKQPFNADADDSGNFLEFMGLAGVGQAEIGNLIRDDIDFEKERIRLYRVKTSTPYFIPLYPQLKPILERMTVRGMRHDQKIFVIKDGKKALVGACKRLGLPAYSQRAFRRMFITRCIELGIDVKVIGDWQGHQDGGKLILATYSHVRKTHADEMAKKLTLPVQ